MTRVNVFAAVCCVALMFVVSNVNAQCASCGQAAQPVFSQSYAAPVSAAVYAQPQQWSVAQPVSLSTPISTGCSSCGSAGLVQPVSYAAPISTGCSSCGCASCAQVAVPVSVGCTTCSTYQTARPQVRQRVRVQRRGNNCNTCAPCSSCN